MPEEEDADDSAPATAGAQDPAGADNNFLTNKNILVTGAAGFIGRRVCLALLQAGFSVRGLVRGIPPPEHRLDGIDYVAGDITDTAAFGDDTFADCGAVVHLVGIITEVRGAGQTFAAVHVRGTENVVRAARRAGTVKRIIYLSALGASAASASEYLRTKARAEDEVRHSKIPFAIFRPSIVLGPGGDFVKQIEALIKRPPLSPFPLPFVPVPGSGKNLFQPVSVDDLAACIVRSLEVSAIGDREAFEIGGAVEISFNQLIESFEKALGVKKPLLPIPSALLFVAASVLEALMPKPPITVDQLINLRTDSVCDNSAVIEAFGVSPRAFAETLATIFCPK